MNNKFKKKKSSLKCRTIKIDPKTHKLLRIYAAENDLWLGEAVQNLLDKFVKSGHNGMHKKSI